jgi:hypothetical protein
MAGFTTFDFQAEPGFPDEERDSRWPLFAQGAPGDRSKPNAWQVMVLSDLSGPDGRCTGATDGEIFGVLGRWGAAGCWLDGRKLAVLRELIRRRPDDRNVGIATESGLPWDWDDRLSREIALELRMSVPAARKLLWAAWSLEARLPGIGKALDGGRIDSSRARMVVEETNVLGEPGALAAAEELILAGLDNCKTWMDLLRLVQRAVVTVDPAGAARRREQEEKENARIRFWREAAGTCALMGAGLPTDEALRAHAHVDQRAQQYRAQGARRSIDILRVAAYLDILNGVPLADRLARFQAEDQAKAAEKAPQASRGTGQVAEKARRAAEEAGRDSEDAQQAAEKARQAAEEASGRATRKNAATARDDLAQSGAVGGHDNSQGSGEPGDGSGSAGGAVGPEGYPWTGPPDDGLPSAEAPCGQCCPGNCPCQDWTPGEANGRDTGSGDYGGAGHDSGDGVPHAVPGGGSGPGTGPAVAAEVNLTLRHIDIPLITAAGYGQRPGEARSLGVLDPALARRLAEAAARHPDSTFCLTITDHEGRAIGHGCCKPRKPPKSGGSHKSGKPGGPGQPGRPGKLSRPGKPGQPSGLGQPGQLPGRGRQAGPGDGERDGPPPPQSSPSWPAPAFTLVPADGPGPPGGYGSWLLAIPNAGRELTVDLHPVPTGECGHQYESARHDPGDRLRHLVNIRDGKCGFPACSRHAKESDFEHCAPFDKGGRTCGCNCWSCSRSCHQVKQSPGWDVTEAQPGYHQWTTPSGRSYTQEPWSYPT